MSFSDDEAPLVGMYDYGAPDYLIRADAKVAAVLAELRSVDRQEAVLRTRIAALTRNARPATAPSSGNVLSLKAYRAFLRDSAGRR